VLALLAGCTSGIATHTIDRDHLGNTRCPILNEIQHRVEKQEPQIGRNGHNVVGLARDKAFRNCYLPHQEDLRTNPN
jgi:hypothetical protein